MALCTKWGWMMAGGSRESSLIISDFVQMDNDQLSAQLCAMELHNFDSLPG